MVDRKFCIPRKGRIDMSGALHHLIIRGFDPGLGDGRT